jgi:hypothetical protein
MLQIRALRYLWPDYERVIGAGAFAKGVKAKDNINPTLGRRTKLRLEAKTGTVFAVPQPSIFTSSSHLHPEQSSSDSVSAT